MQIEKCKNQELLKKMKEVAQSQIKRISEGEQSTLTLDELNEDLFKIEGRLLEFEDTERSILLDP